MLKLARVRKEKKISVRKGLDGITLKWEKKGL